MERSPEIGKLAEALAKAQGEMENAAKDKDNPFFKSTYADLASIWGACRGPLSKHGLAVVQPPCLIGTDGKTYLTTLLMHSSGEFISSIVPVEPVKRDPQGWGSAITYMRRFCLAAMVGVAPAEKPTEDDIDDDDDGNAASGKNVIKPHVSNNNTPKPIVQNPQKKVISKEQWAIGHKIKTLKLELGINDDQLKQVAHSMNLPSEFMEMSLGQASQLLQALENEKVAVDSAVAAPKQPDPDQNAFENFQP